MHVQSILKEKVTKVPRISLPLGAQMGKRYNPAFKLQKIREVKDGLNIHDGESWTWGRP